MEECPPTTSSSDNPPCRLFAGFVSAGQHNTVIGVCLGAISVVPRSIGMIVQGSRHRLACGFRKKDDGGKQKYRTGAVVPERNVI